MTLKPGAHAPGYQLAPVPGYTLPPKDKPQRFTLGYVQIVPAGLLERPIARRRWYTPVFGGECDGSQ